MDSLQQLANSAGDEIIVRYVLLSELEDKFADKNPKLHDIGAICDSIQRHGFKDLLEYDAALNDGGGGIVAGNGRLEALVKLSNSGANAPRGVKVAENGEWAIPVQFGVNSRTTAEGLAYLITNNNLSLSGGNFTALDVSRLYDPDSYVELLEILAAEESLPISVDGDDLDLLVAELSGDITDRSSDIEVDEDSIWQGMPEFENENVDEYKQLPFMFESWSDYRNHLLVNLITNDNHRKEMEKGINQDDLYFADPSVYPDKVREKLIKMHISMILRNDYHGTKRDMFRVTYGKSKNKRS